MRDTLWTIFFDDIFCTFVIYFGIPMFGLWVIDSSIKKYKLRSVKQNRDFVVAVDIGLDGSGTYYQGCYEAARAEMVERAERLRRDHQTRLRTLKEQEAAADALNDYLSTMWKTFSDGKH